MAGSVEEDFEATYQRNVATLMATLSKFIEIEFGERCSTYEPNCPTCKLWKLRDEINEIVK